MADKISIPIESKYDDKGAKEALADAKKIESADPTLQVDAETTNVKRDIDGLMTKVDKLDADTATILLTSNATAIATDITDLIVDLDKLDASDPTVDVKAEQINSLKGDLDQIEAKIRDVNNVPVDVDTKPAQKGMEDIGHSADAAKSVSANAIGNITQDLGALGGVAGSAGVAIGQFGEYFADAAAEGKESLGSIAKNFISVAGPLTAVTVGVGLITQAFQAQAKAQAETKAFNKERVQAFTEALQDATLTTQELQKALESGGKETGIFVRIADQTRNVEESVAKLFHTFDHFQQAVAGGTEGYDKWSQSLIDSAKRAGASGDQVEKLTAALNDARDGTLDVTGVLVGMSPEFVTVTEAAVAYGSAVRDSGKGSQQAAFDQQFYGDALDDTTGKLDANAEGISDNTALLDENAQHITDWYAAQQQANDAAQQFSDTLASADFAHADVAGATAGMQAFHDQLFGLSDVMAASEEAWDGLGASIKENGDNFDLTTEKGRNNQKALEDLASTIDTQMVAAYVDANDNQDTFRQKATTIADDTLARLQKQFGLSSDQAHDLAGKLGLLPEDIETRYQLSGTEEAREKIGLLQSSIDALPKDVQARVTQQIITGDYQGALDTIQSYYTAHPVTSRVVTEPGDVTGTLQLMQGQANRNPIVVPVKAGPAPAPSMTGAGSNRSVEGAPPPVVATPYGVGAVTPYSAVTNVTVNLPRGTRPDDMVRAADRYARRNGRAHARRR
jgi:hypothetical protein